MGRSYSSPEQNKALAKEAMEAIPDIEHPFHITQLKVWDTRWPFHAGTTGVYIDGLNRLPRPPTGCGGPSTDRHSYRNLKFSETSNRDMHMPLSIGMPEPEANKGPAQARTTPGSAGSHDDQPPHTVITHAAPEGNPAHRPGRHRRFSSPVKRVTVNGRRAYSLRGDFAEWETVLELPAPGKSVTLTAVGRRYRRAGGSATRTSIEYRSSRSQVASRPHPTEQLLTNALGGTHEIASRLYA